MSACWRCGISSPSGANFCPSCGAALRSELPDLEVLVEPLDTADGGPVEATAATGSPWPVIVGAALIVGLVAFFALVGGSDNDDEPSADPFEDRSDFGAVAVPDAVNDNADPDADADEGAATDTGLEVAPLEWAITGTEGMGSPLGFADIGDSTFLFTANASVGGDPRVYVRGPSGEWSDGGPMLEAGATLTTVAATDQGAIAAGTDPDGTPTVWRSSDGLTWLADPLPPIGDPGDNAILPQLVAEANGITVVTGAMRSPWERIQAAVEARFGDAAVHTSPEVQAPGTNVLVRGPFGLVIDEFDLGELGLEFLDLTTYFEQPRPMWETSGDGWTTATAGGIVLNLFATDDGRIARNDGTNFGSTITFRDEQGWSDPVEPGRLWDVHPWSDRLIGRSENDRWAVLEPDLETQRRLPVPGSRGYVAFMAGDAEGLALARVDFDPGHDDRKRVVMLRDGFTLAADAGILTLSLDGEVVLRGSLHWEQSRDRYRIDEKDDSLIVAFLDEAGEPLVGFTIEELASLQAATESPWANDHSLSIFASPDGERWAGGEITDPALADVDRGLLHVRDGRVIAALERDPALAAVDGPDLGFVIMEAALRE